MGKKKCKHKRVTYTGYITSTGFNGVKQIPKDGTWGTADGFICDDCNTTFKAENRFPL